MASSMSSTSSSTSKGSAAAPSYGGHAIDDRKKRRERERNGVGGGYHQVHMDDSSNSEDEQLEDTIMNNSIAPPMVDPSSMSYYPGGGGGAWTNAASSTTNNIQQSYRRTAAHSYSKLEHHPVATFVLTLSLGWLLGLFYVWPFPTTVHAIVPLAIALIAWTAIQWASLIQAAIRTSTTWSGFPSSLKWSRYRRIAVLLSSLLTCLICFNAVPPSERSIPLPALIPAHPDIPERYFIAANLYNNEDVIPEWTDQLFKLCEHLGKSNVFISIAESNSKDRTKSLLADFEVRLAQEEIPHRITLEHNTDRSWPYGTSPERISYLAGVRNKAIEPLQSELDSIRLHDAHTFTKIVFLNDVYFSWQSIVRLLATRLDERTDIAADYDLACSFDYGAAGVYDTWVARDVCGTPLRTFWPYFKDRQSIDHIKSEKPVEVAACWNGAVAMPAEPYIRHGISIANSAASPTLPALSKRGWRMMDNDSYPHTLHSPPVASPFQFRGPNYTDPCDHSECFLHSYDIHRKLKGERRPRIYMNPAVKVAYELNWYRWQNTILRIPSIRYWLRIWSRGIPFWFVDGIYEKHGRRRDYCTWAGLQIADRCPPLSSPKDIGWENG